jgi:hypothetical protein
MTVAGEADLMTPAAPRRVRRRVLRRRVAVGAVVALVLGVGLGFGYRLATNHNDYRVWSLAPTEPTPIVTYGGRHYAEGEVVAADALAGTHQVGRTADGSAIYAPPSSYAPTGITIRLRSGELISYALMGGP